MNKKAVKILASILAIILLIGFISTNVFAESGSLVKPTDIESNISYANSTTILKLAGKIMGFIRNLAVIGGVILLMILGVKYMMGSVEEKADYKKSLIPLVIGILVVMSATSIMTFVVDFFSQNS